MPKARWLLPSLLSQPQDLLLSEDWVAKPNCEEGMGKKSGTHKAPDGEFDAPQRQVEVPITTVKVSGLYSPQMVRKPLPFTAPWHLSALPLACCFFPSLTTCLK